LGAVAVVSGDWVILILRPKDVGGGKQVHLVYTGQIARNQRGSQKPEVQKVYEDTKYLRDVCDAHNVTMLDWIAMDYEERIDIIHETLLKMTNERMFEFLPNPPASECPFISRHSVGRWGKPSDPKATWSCVCGSSHILSKNWEKHEESEKHKAWMGGRRVTKNLKKTMTENLHPERKKKELLGWEIHYERWHFCDQDVNEWTHPEMFADNIPQSKPREKWIAGNWKYGIKHPLKAPKIKCAHDPLLPENQARYGRAQILAPLPRLPHQQQFWGQQAGGYLAYSHEMMQADYDAWIAMAE